MKIAILFSGRIYKFGSHYNNIMENVVQDHEADFYLSHSPEIKEEADLELFKEIYNPIALSNDPIPEFDFEQYDIIEEFYTKRRNVVSMFYNRMRVFELMKNSGKIYDCLVSYRLDLFSYNKIDYTIDSNSIYIPEGCDHYNGINDQVAYGSYESMSIYMNVFSFMKGYLDEKKCKFHPEQINKCHLISNSVPIVRTGYIYNIVRGGDSLYI